MIPEADMKRKINQLLHISAFCFLFLVPGTCLAQQLPSPPMPVPNYATAPYRYNLGIPNKHYVYTIVFLNDSSIEGKGKIDISKQVHELNCKVNRARTSIRPSETKEISRVDAEGRTLVGKPMDSCWAFLVGIGRIRTYSVTAEIDDPSIAFIQKGDFSPIVALTLENLEPMVADNEKALEFARKGRLTKAVSVYNKERNETLEE